MKLKNFPKFTRPRERLVSYGVERLTYVELLAVVLGTGKKGENVLHLAKRVHQHILDRITSVNYKDFEKISGLGQAKICRLLACLELGKRLFQNKQTQLLISAKDVWFDLRDIRGQKKEYFIVFFLDVRNQIIKKEVISIGTLNASLVHPREVFEPAVRYSAGQIIISHNHPSGETKPSEEGLILTEQLAEAGKIMGIEIIDHVIVAEKGYLSFKEKGLL